MTEFGELNGEYCSGLVVTADALTAILGGDYSVYDPNKVTWLRQKGDDYVAADDLDESLEGSDAGVSMCRSEYDNNDVAAQQSFFCCQILNSDGDFFFATSTLGKMTKNDQESFEFFG